MFGGRSYWKLFPINLICNLARQKLFFIIVVTDPTGKFTAHDKNLFLYRQKNEKKL